MAKRRPTSPASVRRQLASARPGERSPAVRIGVILAVAAALIGALLFGIRSARPATPQAAAGGPEGVPVPAGAPLAAVGTTAGGAPVAAVGCQSGEQVAYHIHTHLAVFVDGHPRQIPAGIGIAAPRQVQTTPTGEFVDSGSCLYWLHTHAADGIIHVESPTQATYTLGQFFAIWQQPLGPNQVGPLHGPVTVFVDSQRQAIDPRAITLTAHRVIQLDVGTPSPAPQSVSFPPGL
jgi:hypothetical protein